MSALVKGAYLRRRAKTVIGGYRPAYGKPVAPMASMIAKAAGIAMRAYISGAPIIVRFHGDGDGAAGAISLYRAFGTLVAAGVATSRQVSWQLNRDVVYTKEAFYSDRLLFASYRSVERPLLILIDFGTHIDSNEAIRMAEKMCEVVWIDHHTLPEGFEPGSKCVYINPFMHGSDSRLTAGLVASIMAETIGAECKDVMEAALISDHSACADYDNKNAKMMGLVVDYLITRRDSDSSSLRRINDIITDGHKLEELYHDVGGMMHDAIITGEKVMKQYRTSDGVGVFVIDFRKVKAGDYPPSGRFCSEMQYYLEGKRGGPAITVTYYTSYISVRVSKTISEKVGLIGIIGKLSEDSSGQISGGGHKEAASIKAGGHTVSEVVKIFLDALGAH